MLIALYLRLVLDYTRRVGELLDGASSAKLRYPDRYFRRKYITLYAFSATVYKLCPATFMADVLFKGLKSRVPDLSKSKTIPLRLLPLGLAAEYLLRWRQPGVD